MQPRVVGPTPTMLSVCGDKIIIIIIIKYIYIAQDREKLQMR